MGVSRSIGGLGDRVSERGSCGDGKVSGWELDFE